MTGPFTESKEDQLNLQDAWRQAITPSPSFSSSSKSYMTANTNFSPTVESSPDSIRHHFQPYERQELLHNASKGIYSKKVPRQCPSLYKVNNISRIYRSIATKVHLNLQQCVL